MNDPSSGGRYYRDPVTGELSREDPVTGQLIPEPSTQAATPIAIDPAAVADAVDTETQLKKGK